ARRRCPVTRFRFCTEPHQNPHVPRPRVRRLAEGSRCGGSGPRPVRRQSGIAAYARRAPFGSIAVARPSERAVRTESDTVRTTPVQVIAQAATGGVPPNTARGPATHTEVREKRKKGRRRPRGGGGGGGGEGGAPANRAMSGRPITTES